MAVSIIGVGRGRPNAASRNSQPALPESHADRSFGLGYTASVSPSDTLASLSLTEPRQKQRPRLYLSCLRHPNNAILPQRRSVI